MPRYAELLPDELEKTLSERPAAALAWGALEWHGPHLPLGLDGLVADWFAGELAERVGCVSLPATYLPITCLPHKLSLSIRSEVVRRLWADLFAELQRAGFRALALVSGHYAHPHELLLMDAAEEARRNGLAVIAGPPLSVLSDDSMLDHAAHWETSELMAVRPDLVRLDKLDAAEAARPAPDLAAHAVLGVDPRKGASAQAGAQALGRALEIWETLLLGALAGEVDDYLDAWYARRRASYQGFVDQFYRGSWEAALAEWWRVRTKALRSA